MVIVARRLANPNGIHVVLDEDVLRAMKLYDRLRAGEEVGIVLADIGRPNPYLREADAGDGHRGSVLRLRTDGRAEAAIHVLHRIR